jgi:hypothetical protein
MVLDALGVHFRRPFRNANRAQKRYKNLVARYESRNMRRYFRADAAFAQLELYEHLNNKSNGKSRFKYHHGITAVRLGKTGRRSW